MDWQSIETALKNMTEIIVLCGRENVPLGWYFAPSSQTFGWLDQNSKRISPAPSFPLTKTPAALPQAMRKYYGGEDQNRVSEVEVAGRRLGKSQAVAAERGNRIYRHR